MPVNTVATYFNNSNELLATAAERYLVSEDSFEARRIVLTKYPNEAKILGARRAFIPNKKANFENLPIYELFQSLVGRNYYYYNRESGDLDKTQEKLREEVKANKELSGVYAFLVNDSSGHKILRLYRDKAVYSWYEDDARFRERIVNKNELKLIFDYVADNQIEDLKPIFGSCHHGCPTSEFVMFGRNGGRRIFTSAYNSTQPLLGLQMAFEALEQGKSKLRYHLQNKIVGLKVLLDEKNIKAKSVWKNGDDFRVLVFDEKKEELLEKDFQQKYTEARKSVGLDDDDYENYKEKYETYSKLAKSIREEKQEKEYEAYTWRSVVNSKLGKTLSQPDDFYFIRENGEFPVFDDLDANEKLWKTSTSEFELRVGDYEKKGVWKVFKNGLTAQVAKNKYILSPVISKDGKWAIVTKGRNYDYLGKSYRLKLQSGKEFEVKLPITISTKPIAYVESQNKFLIYSYGYKELVENSSYMIEELKEKV